MNQLYVAARQKFLTGQLNWDAVDVKLVLLDANYIFDENHEFLADIATGQVASSDITSETSTDGYAQGQPAFFIGLSHTEPVTQAALYVDTGDANTSDLIAFYDDIDGFPFTPGGLDYFISQDIVFGGFFRI